MSNHFKPTFYNDTAKEKQYLNCLVNCHDLWCGCDEPLKHTASTIFKFCGPTDFNEEDKQNILKCLGNGTTTTTAADGGDQEDGGFGPGDLEKLFSEPDIEDDTG